MMRRVRLEKLMRTKRCQNWFSRASRRRLPFSGNARFSSGRSGSTSVFKFSGVRLSTVYLPVARPASNFLEPIADTVKRFDHVEVVVGALELLAQPLDVAVDGAVVDIDLVVVGGVHQGVAALDHAGAARERLQDEELGDRERDRLVLPRAGVALGIHAQEPALEHLGGIGLLRRRAVLRRGPAQDRLDALDQEALRERFADEIVGAHLEAEQFVDL